MKRPLLPKKLTRMTLHPTFFDIAEDYREFRLDGGSFIGQQTDGFRLTQGHLQDVKFDAARFEAPQLTDSRLRGCSMANTNCERILARRTEFVNCRLIGVNFTNGHLQDVLFRECDLQLSSFRYASFKSVTFVDCILRSSNFQGAQLSGTQFLRCDLSDAEMSQAKLVGTDFRTSKIEGLRVGVTEVVGAVVDHFQAAYVAGLLGIVVKREDEP